jgi:pimeloyl-ACP methyl ester carboxylesterase
MGKMLPESKRMPGSIGSWRSRFKRAMTAVGLILATVLLVGLAYLFAISPGRPDPLRAADGTVIPGSLSERVTVEIGGIPQAMIIQSVDPANPVLLFVHGGPGMTEFFMEQDYPTGLERHFTMVWWEQRGAGMSFTADIPPETMTMDQMIADTVGVADYLRKRFGQDRILLLGHSWGSYLGIQVAAKAPDRFLAYVGMAQITHQLRSEAMAHEFLLGAYKARGDDAMVRKLEAAPVSMEAGLSPAWMRLRDAAMQGAGVGHTRNIDSVITGIFLPVWRVRAYTLTDKINVWRGKLWSRPFFWEYLLRDDLRTRLIDFDLPVYFMVGRHDQTANPTLSRSYFDMIDAPVKGFYTFESSAHSPLFEEPLRATDILLQDVMRGTNAQADVEGDEIGGFE